MAWYHLLYNVKPGAAAKPPLAVDLDGTLIRGDLFLESMLRFGFARPWQLPLLLVWLMRGRAHAKRRLAEQFPVTAADLPYDERILAWLGEERAQGRTIVLATASDSRAAAAVAEHLGLFDQVFASDGRVMARSRHCLRRSVSGVAMAALFGLGITSGLDGNAPTGPIWAIRGRKRDSGMGRSGQSAQR